MARDLPRTWRAARRRPATSGWRWAALAAAVIAVWMAAAPWAAPAAAQSGEGGSAPVMGEGVPSVAALFMTSPYINTALLALSVLALMLFFYLVLSLDGRSFSPPRFIDDVTKLILNRQFERAIHLCQSNARVFAASIIQRVIENRDKEPGVLMDILTAEGRRRGEVIWNRTGYLAEISNVAPMLGLLGTVIGMIKVFFTLTTRTVGEQASQLSAGIAEAMGTTMFGLIVAIAAGVFYAIARSRATAALSEAEQVCHTIADHTHRAGEAARRRESAGPDEDGGGSASGGPQVEGAAAGRRR